MICYNNFKWSSIRGNPTCRNKYWDNNEPSALFYVHRLSRLTWKDSVIRFILIVVIPAAINLTDPHTLNHWIASTSWVSILQQCYVSLFTGTIAIETDMALWDAGEGEDIR